MTAAERADRTTAADRLCADAYRSAGGPDTGVALVAVGGYGRGELAPYSDLDVVLVHEDDVTLGRIAQDLWYPLWDSGRRLDHSVRSVSETLETAAGDLRAALGLLDVRLLAGDPHLVLRLRTRLLAQWRAEARERLPELARLVRRRHEVVGELAHLSVPDLKEAAGGLRDAVVLKALVATWLVDVPHTELERSRQVLLDVRDVLHDGAGRPVDRIGPEAWVDLAPGLGLPGPEAAQRLVRATARRLAHLTGLTWRRAEAVLDRPPGGRRGPRLVPLAAGVAATGGEVVLDGTVPVDQDPTLLLRCAAEAAERGLALSPVTAARLVAEGVPMPRPWPAEARQLLVRMLGAGDGLQAVWETLDETGALDGVLPEWESIRLLPHASAIHRFTVDRHVVETCSEAVALIRQVGRPDLLLVTALLHDIGKGERGDHSVAGERVARRVAAAMGFDPEDVETIATLVRWHLLLAEAATTRDPDDPATARLIADRLGTSEAVELLLALSEADARATSAPAWSGWRAGLVRALAARTITLLDEERAGRPLVEAPDPELHVPADLRADPDDVHVEIAPSVDGSRVSVVSQDRLGLLADASGMLAVHRLPVRSARVWTRDGFGASEWEVGAGAPDATVLRQTLLGIVAGRVDVAERLLRSAADTSPQPVVVVRPEASASATVLEVRTADRPGVVHLVCAALASLGVWVRSAHVSTLGPQAVDVFYVQEEGAGALSEERAATAAHTVRQQLERGYRRQRVDTRL